MASIIHQLLLAAASIPKHPDDVRNHWLLAAKPALWNKDDGSRNPGFRTTPEASVRIRFYGDVST